MLLVKQDKNSAFGIQLPKGKNINYETTNPISIAFNYYAYWL